MAKSKTNYPELQIKLGKRIKQIRDANNYTRDELSELSSLSPQNIAKIEAGERFVTADSLTRLADALKVQASDLFIFEQDGRRRSPLRRKLEILLLNRSEPLLTLVHDVAARILKEF